MTKRMTRIRKRAPYTSVVIRQNRWLWDGFDGAKAKEDVEPHEEICATPIQ